MSLHTALQRDWSSHLQAFVSWVFALQSTMICTEKSVHASSVSWSLCLYLLWIGNIEVQWAEFQSNLLQCHCSSTRLISPSPSLCLLSLCSAVYNDMYREVSSCKQSKLKSMPISTLKTHTREAQGNIEVQWAEFQSNLLQCHCTSARLMFPSPNLCLFALQSTMQAVYAHAYSKNSHEERNAVSWIPV